MDIAEQFSGRAMKENARHLASIHPRMVDYLQQAPVIAATLQNGDGWRQTRKFLHHACTEGMKLRSLMSCLGLPYVLRKADAKGFPYAYPELMTALRNVKPQVLASQIDRRTYVQQYEYWHFLDQWRKVPQPSLFWMAEHLPPDAPPCGHVQDYIVHRFHTGNRAPIRNWDELAGGMKRWEAEFDDRAKLNAINSSPDALKPLSPLEHRAEITVGAYQFTALNTRAELAIEGAAMRHCVGGYHDYIRKGLAFIYSVKEAGERVATAEYQADKGVLILTQIKGRFNFTPDAEVRAAAKTAAREILPNATT